jgi:phosphoserine phosphatase
MLVTTQVTMTTAPHGRVATRLLLARHGETDWNRLGRWQGQQNTPLNAAGRVQALALRDTLKKEPLAAVYSSALRRCVETAHEIAEQHRLNVCRDERLNEINLGKWEGLTQREIAARYPEALQVWYDDPRAMRPPQGESVAELEQRVLAVLQEMARAYPGETVCLVGHKMTNGLIRSHYLGLPLAEALHGVEPHGGYEVILIPHPLWG